MHGNLHDTDTQHSRGKKHREVAMARKLAFQALELVGKNWSKGSLTIEKNRGNIKRLAKELEKRFGLENIHNLKPGHIKAVIDDMREKELSSSTICSYITAARTVARAIGKPNIVPRTNEELGISRKAERYQPIDADMNYISQIREWLYTKSTWQGLAHDLRQAFGLRAKESLLSCQTKLIDGVDYLEVKGAKGGRIRGLPIISDAQREVVDQVNKHIRGHGQRSLVPKEMTLKQAYDRQRNDLHRLGAIKSLKANAHAVRHHYAQEMRSMGLSEQDLTELMGHGRTEILKHYCA